MSRNVGRNRTWWMFAGFLAIAGFFLLTEHRAHLFGVLPVLFLLACPLLHMFGHGGHGGHGEHADRSSRGRNADPRSPDQDTPNEAHHHYDASKEGGRP